jgi:hypothetical protein
MGSPKSDAQVMFEGTAGYLEIAKRSLERAETNAAWQSTVKQAVDDLTTAVTALVGYLERVQKNMGKVP